MEEKYYIYKHTNNNNNKVYIGIAQNYKQRWNSGFGYQNNNFFFKDIVKYGWNNFTHEILEDNLTKKEALEKELKYIEKYQSNKKEFGYNIISLIHKNANSIPVKCIETGQIFESKTAASKWCHLSDFGASITKYLRGEKTFAGKHPITNQKLHWELANDYINNIYNIN